MVNKLPCMAVTAFLAEKIQDLKIAVIGDVMLDRYFHGEVKRISPEAPVPVTKINREKSVLGGASNVAANLAHLGCKVFMGGVTGDDDNRVLFRSNLVFFLLKKQLQPNRTIYSPSTSSHKM